MKLNYTLSLFLLISFTNQINNGNFNSFKFSSCINNSENIVKFGNEIIINYNNNNTFKLLASILYYFNSVFDSIKICVFQSYLGNNSDNIIKEIKYNFDPLCSLACIKIFIDTFDLRCFGECYV